MHVPPERDSQQHAGCVGFTDGHCISGRDALSDHLSGRHLIADHFSGPHSEPDALALPKRHPVSEPGSDCLTNADSVSKRHQLPVCNANYLIHVLGLAANHAVANSERLAGLNC
jgi:hypothetical protein